MITTTNGAKRQNLKSSIKTAINPNLCFLSSHFISKMGIKRERPQTSRISFHGEQLDYNNGRAPESPSSFTRHTSLAEKFMIKLPAPFGIQDSENGSKSHPCMEKGALMDTSVPTNHQSKRQRRYAMSFHSAREEVCHSDANETTVADSGDLVERFFVLQIEK